MDSRQAFLDTLEQENHILEQLIVLGHAKQAHVADAQQISAFSSQEQSLIAQLQQAETERESLFGKIAPGQTLNTWLEQSENGTGLAQEHILALREKLGTLRELNDVNKQLIQESLAYIQFSLNMLIDDSSTTYAKRGNQAQNKSFFDRKV